jgi:NADPH:quinone reductase
MKARAVGFLKALPIDDPDALLDLEVEVGDPGPYDLLVEVRAVSVNPVDVKVRASRDTGGKPTVLGYDAAGVVVGVGDAVSAYSIGDEVWYSGSIARQGTNAELHLVDERIVGHKPASLDFADAAAMPLTTLTAWETLFDRLRLTSESSGTLVVMAAAGGVGSMVVQLARQLTNLTIIGTASRPDSAGWARGLGAHHIVNHHHLVDEVKAVAPDGVDYLFTPFTAGNIEAFAEILKPHGEIVAIDEAKNLDIVPLKSKSITWHWELMFTRPLYEPESTYQRELLDEVARLVDAGVIRSTRTQTFGPLNAETLRQAHRQVESSGTIGKVVVTL